MALIDELKAAATTILGDPEFGRPVTLRRTTGTVSDPVAGTVAKTTSDIVANSFFDTPGAFNTPEAWNVEANDVLAYLDKEISIEDQVIRDSIVWNVINVKAYEAGDGIALWAAQLRR